MKPLDQKTGESVLRKLSKIYFFVISHSYPSYLDIRERDEVVSGLAAYSIGQFKLGGANQLDQIR